MQLNDYVGRQIPVLLPRFHGGKLQRVKLHGVETGGIWIESQAITNEALGTLSGAPKTLVVFVPYHEVAFALGTIGEPSQVEKAFGV